MGSAVKGAVEPAGWLKRNRRALLAVLVLLPATLGIMFANQWLGYFEEWPSRPVPAAAGETIEYGNARWSIETSDRVLGDSAAGRERNLPAGSDLLVVTVAVDPTGTGPDGKTDLCSARLEESGRQEATRTWSNTGPISLDGPGPERTSCSSTLTTPYTFDAQFVVPADAGKASSLSVSIVVVEALPDYASLALD